jgi:hypothetical protein
MRKSEEIYQQIAELVEKETAKHRKISLEELKCNKTIFLSVEDMIYHFYSVLSKQIERERETILRAVSEVLAQASEKSCNPEN